MKIEILQFIGVTTLSLLNLVLLAYQALKRLPKETRKMDAETRDLYGELAESNMQGAQLSNDLLLQRVQELKKDKRDAWNHIAALKRQIIEAGMVPPPFVPTESDPKIQKVDPK